MICVISWSHTPSLFLCINLVITKYELKSQYVKLTQLWPLTVKCVLSLIWQACHKIFKNLHIWRRNKCSNFSFTIFSLMFFPLLPKVFTDILKIYELHKIYNKIPKYYQILTIIIWLLNCAFINYIENKP